MSFLMSCYALRSMIRRVCQAGTTTRCRTQPLNVAVGDVDSLGLPSDFRRVPNERNGQRITSFQTICGRISKILQCFLRNIWQRKSHLVTCLNFPARSLNAHDHSLTQGLIAQESQSTFEPKSKFQLPSSHESWRCVRIQLWFVLRFGSIKHQLTKCVVCTLEFLPKSFLPFANANCNCRISASDWPQLG